MTTPFKAKAEGVLAKVPQDATDIHIADNRVIYRECGLLWDDGLILPPGDWQLVGTSDTMSEDDWKGIVHDPQGNYKKYKDYKNGGLVWTADASGHSLLPDPSKRYAVIIKEK